MSRHINDLEYEYYKTYLINKGIVLNPFADYNTLRKQWLEYRIEFGGGNDLTSCRYFYNFDGVDDVIEAGQRLIPSPVNDDFNIPFELVGVVSNGTIVSQNVMTLSAQKEFHLYILADVIQFVIGGVITTTTVVPTAGVWDVDFTGSTYTITKDSVQVEQDTFTRGTATEPTATFAIGARHGNSLSSYGYFYEGVIANVGVNATSLFLIDDNSNAIRDSLSPQSLGTELMLNWDFSDGKNDWLDSNVTWLVDGQTNAVITPTAQYGAIKQTINVEAGEQYLIVVDVVDGGDSKVIVDSGDATPEQFSAVLIGGAVQSFLFTPNTSSVRLQISNRSVVPAPEITVSSLSVKKAVGYAILLNGTTGQWEEICEV